MRLVPVLPHQNTEGKVSIRCITIICRNFGTEKSVFYMIVDESNQPSIRGIESRFR